MPKPLVINAPSQGIAPSAMQGFANMRNLDIYSVPGIAKLNNILAKVSGSNVTATVKWVVRDPVTVANFYAVDSSGDVYVSTDSGAGFAALLTQPTDGGAGQGLAIWKDYLWCPRATAMDLYGPLSSSPAWRNSWAGLTMTSDTLWHPLLVSELDDKLYGGAGRDVFTVAEVSGQTFLWSNSATYTATAQALSGRLPANYRVKCLAELGNNLMIGTWKGANISDFKLATIIPWDGSASTYGQPIFIRAHGVNAMLSDNGYLYILAGIEGKLYKSNGVQAWVIAQIPSSLIDLSNGKYLEPYPGAIMNFKERLFFSLSSSTTAGKIVSDGVGIYSCLETGRGTILNFEHFISREVTGSANPTIIGSLLGVTRDQLLAGWRDNATYGIDLTTISSYAYTTNYSGYFDSPFYQIGTILKARQFSQIEFLLAKALATGEGIKVEYRNDLNGSWTTIGTFTHSSIGAKLSHNANVNIPESFQIQFRISLLGTSTTSPELRSVILE